MSETDVESSAIPTMNAELVADRPADGSDGVFPLSQGGVIGRFDPDVGPIEVDLGDLPDGNYVSRKHARITPTESGWQLEDMDSSNGTWHFANGDWVRLTEPLVLGDGDRVAFGNARMTFRFALDEEDSPGDSGVVSSDPVPQEADFAEVPANEPPDVEVHEPGEESGEQEDKE